MPDPVRPEATQGSHPGARARRALRHRLFPLAVATGALLLFLWPFVRAPTLSLGQAWTHLTMTWLLLIVTLIAMGFALGGSASGEEDLD